MFTQKYIQVRSVPPSDWSTEGCTPIGQTPPSWADIPPTRHHPRGRHSLSKHPLLVRCMLGHTPLYPVNRRKNITFLLLCLWEVKIHWLREYCCKSYELIRRFFIHCIVYVCDLNASVRGWVSNSRTSFSTHPIVNSDIVGDVLVVRSPGSASSSESSLL